MTSFYAVSALSCIYSYLLLLIFSNSNFTSKNEEQDDRHVSIACHLAPHFTICDEVMLPIEHANFTLLDSRLELAK